MDKRVLGIVVTVAILVAGIVGIAFGTIDRMRENRLTSRGIHVDGKVIDTQILKSRRFSSSRNRTTGQADDVTFVLIVSYKAGASTQTKRFDATYLAYVEHKIGDSIEVLYNPNDPTEAQLGGNLNAVSSSYILFGGIAAFLIGGLLITAMIASARTKYPGDPDDALDSDPL